MFFFASLGIGGFGTQILEVSRIHATKAVQESHSQFTKPFHNYKLSKLVVYVWDLRMLIIRVMINLVPLCSIPL